MSLLCWGGCFGGGEGGQTLKAAARLQQCASTVVWLCLGYPALVLAHGLVCVTAWLLVVLIPVAKLSARTVARVLLLPPERVVVRRLRMVGASVWGRGSCTLLLGGFWGGGWHSERCHLLVPPQTEVPLEGEVILCCYRAVNPYYYKYAVDGINVFAVSILSWAGGQWGGGTWPQIPPHLGRLLDRPPQTCCRWCW